MMIRGLLDLNARNRAKLLLNRVYAVGMHLRKPAHDKILQLSSPEASLFWKEGSMFPHLTKG
jgi:hypothetical protein